MYSVFKSKKQFFWLLNIFFYFFYFSFRENQNLFQKQLLNKTLIFGCKVRR